MAERSYFNEVSEVNLNEIFEEPKSIETVLEGLRFIKFKVIDIRNVQQAQQNFRSWKTIEIFLQTTKTTFEVDKMSA